jgi:hypothetical protein
MDDDENAPVTEKRPAYDGDAEGGGKPNKSLLVAVAAVALLLIGAGVALVQKLGTPDPAFILVDVPTELRGKARVNLNGEDLGVPASFPLLQKTLPGPAVVVVSADGYESFTQTVQVEGGQNVPRVEAKLARKVKFARLVIITTPTDAELKVDGNVVRAQGSGEPYVGEVEVGSQPQVEVKAPGFRVWKKAVAIESEKAVNLTPTLEPEDYAVQVDSVPPGATILAGGKELGVTPKLVTLAPSVKEVELRLRCHDDLKVAVGPGAAGQPPLVVKKELKKQPKCK